MDTEKPDMVSDDLFVLSLKRLGGLTDIEKIYMLTLFLVKQN